jgi:radical SAM superfamily enzyme YgiQ (UPF0313 family)
MAEVERCDHRAVLFIDDNLIADRSRAAELFQGLVPLRRAWAGQVPVQTAFDRPLLSLMARSGCMCLLIGFESLEPKSLAQMNKPANDPATYGEAMARFRDAGIMVIASFVLGYDWDTADTLERTLAFAVDHKVALAHFNHLRPYPGTSTYAALRQENRLVDKAWWRNPALRFDSVTYHPRHMTALQLQEKCEAIRETFHALGCQLYRATDFRANCATPKRALQYFVLNHANRAGLEAKRDLPFGDASDFRASEKHAGSDGSGDTSPGPVRTPDVAVPEA